MSCSIAPAIGFRSFLETSKRRPHDAGADLPAILAGNADVEDGKYLAIEDLEDVDACRRAAKPERWNEIVGILSDRDRVEFLVARDHRPVGAALVALQRRGGGLREAAKPDRFGDDALAAHPRDLVLGVAL